MSEQQTDASTQNGNDTSDTTSGAGDEFKPITSQDDLNRIITDRIGRERSKFADYKDLKAKAQRFDELEAANKSEIDKANDAKAQAEARAARAEADALRLRVAAKHGISDEDADLFLTGTDEETLARQATRLSQHSSDRKKNGNVVPREGTTTSALQNDERATARALFGSGG
ncbi:MAG: hypothetical protein JWR83_3604 [Aeromicrobium sp.]|nr:hypothetical protein [Aeromicrobium sp.]